MRVRGLKFCNNIPQVDEHLVAPHAGAWIEITNYEARLCVAIVAPHAGAWIEISGI